MEEIICGQKTGSTIDSLVWYKERMKMECEMEHKSAYDKSIIDCNERFDEGLYKMKNI